MELDLFQDIKFHWKNSFVNGNHRRVRKFLCFTKVLKERGENCFKIEGDVGPFSNA